VSFGARALIRLGAISHNLQTIKDRAAGARVMAVIKANAYGHGLLPVAGCLDAADCLAVARLGEACDLREAGIAMPIALLSGAHCENDLDQAIELDLQLSVHTESQVELLEHWGPAGVTVWLKIDTGMNRLGFRPHEVPNLIDRLRVCASVADIRLMTHLANAENLQDDTTTAQIAEFRKIVDGFEGNISIANSSAIFAWQEDLGPLVGQRSSGSVWVRPGLALYGISPYADRNGRDLGLRPAMRFESQLVAVKTLGKGETVGYGGTWAAERDTVLGIAAVGYGDGYSRFIPSGSPIIVNDRLVKTAGLVSMDLTAIDLGPGAIEQPGDPVLLWGGDLPVEEVARHAGTIPYQLVCGIGNRVESVFED
jgi:alanine racemase